MQETNKLPFYVLYVFWIFFIGSFFTFPNFVATFLGNFTDLTYKYLGLRLDVITSLFIILAVLCLILWAILKNKLATHKERKKFIIYAIVVPYISLVVIFLLIFYTIINNLGNSWI